MNKRDKIIKAINRYFDSLSYTEKLKDYALADAILDVLVEDKLDQRSYTMGFVEGRDSALKMQVALNTELFKKEPDIPEWEDELLNILKPTLIQFLIAEKEYDAKYKPTAKDVEEAMAKRELGFKCVVHRVEDFIRSEFKKMGDEIYWCKRNDLLGEVVHDAASGMHMVSKAFKRAIDQALSKRGVK